ncbi:MAG: elongation factor P maturation arginine rhamnosyltransferase EarP [Methylotenera sp.]|nr:elongation factor P maturation arginine rhamnosyltransferase EarP [Methylotenera sp.]
MCATASLHKKMRWDIFCKIVDNFGDIGVCWRLAKQLQAEHHVNICLWVDDLSVAQKLIPDLNIAAQTQVINHITICAWHEHTTFNQAADVVIEGFSCTLPAAYISLMRSDTVWINLEYLSAEPWVAGFHAGSGKHAELTRHFFFPGFTEATGGLIREADTTHAMRHFNANSNDNQNEDSSLKISLFAYPHAPIADLLEVLTHRTQAIDCYVPTSNIFNKIADFFGNQNIHIGDTLTRGNLHVHLLPFLSQDDYDQLLRSCDLNFVRGEDSWIRAIWAGKPFIWLPYWQTENTHTTKLNAFLALFYANFNQKQVVCEAHQYWLSGHVPQQVWQRYLHHLPAISTFTLQQAKQLATHTDLATKLVIFSEKIVRNQV